jgi:hypothetical protein
MSLQTWLPAQDSPEIPVNENFEALSHMAVYAKDATTTAGLTWGYLGGRWGGFAVAAGTLTLPASSTVYITVSRATGAISANTTDANWTNIDLHARVYKLVTGAATVTTIEDYRAGHGGVHGITEAPGGGGSSMAPIVPVSGVSKALTLDDAGTYLRFTAAGGKTLTIDVAAGFAAGQEFHIANRSASGDLTLTPTGVTLNAPKGGALVLEQKDTVTIKFISSTEADVFGSTKGGA